MIGSQIILNLVQDRTIVPEQTRYMQPINRRLMQNKGNKMFVQRQKEKNKLNTQE